MENELSKRLFDFSVRVIKYTRKLPKSKENDVIVYQLIKSVTSAPSNYEEAQAASSRADFKNKVNISLKEMRETNFWLRLLKALDNKSDDLDYLIAESKELKDILGAICSKVSKNH